MDKQPNSSKYLKIFLKLLLVVILFSSSIGTAAYFMATKPTPQKQKPQIPSLFVETLTAQKAAVRTLISGMGTVVPSKRILMKAQVPGVVVAVSDQFIPGGYISKGNEILRIDPSDYEIAVKKRESELNKAQADYELEQGQQAVAREEMNLLQDVSEEPVNQTYLALRKPQLNQAKAQMAIAESELALARLNLERTILKAPFNALVVDRQVETGSNVSNQELLATIVSTDEYWVEAALPADQLRFIDPECKEDCTVQVFSQTGRGKWIGKVLHSMGTIDENSRMSKMLIRITNPLISAENADANPLMLGDYVRVEIKGRELGEMVSLPRKALRRGDMVWIADGERLNIRNAEIAWKSATEVYVSSGISPGESIILSEIKTPVAGMPIDIAEHEPNSTQTLPIKQADAPSPDSEKAL
ncbi:MAG: efflux RND transporter periplasmic adaptor subunit [Desulfobacula sp.]|nr:efflux RND transporter periplasmic adaptor subunit [Desulfobacula sp.]